MQKLIRDGKVAVLYSRGYGCGWYSEHGNLDLLFHPVLVELVLSGNNAAITHELVTALGITVDANHVHPDDVRWLEVEWIPEGALFRIQMDEDDNRREVVVLQDQHQWIRA